MVLAEISAARAAHVLDVDPKVIAKLKDTAVLAGPPDRPTRRTGIYAPSLDTAASVLWTTVAAGDVAVHLGSFEADLNHHYGRADAGWHQQKSLALPAAQRRDCWRGVWHSLSLADARGCVGGTAVATVGGFIVDVASITGASACPCCGDVVFDLDEPSPEAVARYRGRRMRAEKGPTCKLGTGA